MPLPVTDAPPKEHSPKRGDLARQPHRRTTISRRSWRMIDFPTAKMRSQRRNIKRYCRLLATELTDLERQYLHKRIAEEHAQLERLKKSKEEQHAEVRPISVGEHCDMIGAGE